MKSWYRKSIRNKVTSVVLLAVVPALLLASIAAAVREADLQQASFRIELSGIASALAAAASEPLASGDKRQVANALKGIGAIPNISHVNVSDASGRQVFQFGHGIVVNSVGESSGLLTTSSRTVPIETNIKHSGQVIGKLQLIADSSKIRDGLKRSIGVAFLTGLAAAFFGVLGSIKMQRSVSRPLLNLQRAMMHVRQSKDFSHIVPQSSEDEIAQLVDSFNGMILDIRIRDEALAEHRNSLERVVEQRTKELATAVNEAQFANNAKSDFLATMSHEIRTPMNGMLVMAELLAASDLNPRAERHCQVILRSGQTLLAIINDVLDLSKIEAGKLTLESTSCDLFEVVDDVLKLFSERASSKGLEIAGYVAANVPSRVLADSIRLSQIIGNLLNNAIKFTETGGVLIKVDRGRSGQIRFSVTDTGIGIHADKLATIFDPFTQAEQSTARKYGGTGIGLTICNKLASAMGGTLKVDSTLGSGSTFSFEVGFEEETPADVPVAATLRRNIIVTTLAEGPVLQAVKLMVADHGFKVERADENRNMAGVCAYLSTPERIEELAQFGSHVDCPVIVLTRFGQSGRDPGRRFSDTTVTLDVPFDAREFHQLLNELAAGRKVVNHIAHSDPIVASESIPFKGKRALAADDSAVNCEVLMEALHRLGLEVTCVTDGAAAVAAAKQGSFDIVFMDGSMPIMDGYDATRALRSWEASTGRIAMPIVGLSAHVMGKQASQWRDCGMTDYVSKPFTLSAIRACLTRWLDQSELINEVPPAALTAAEAVSGVLLDLEVLQSIREMQPPGLDLVAKISGLYCDHTPKLLEALLAFEQSPQDFAGLASAAHALRSISRNVGAIRVGDICCVIEDAARDGRNSLSDHRNALEQALSETTAALAIAASCNNELSQRLSA